MNRRLRLSYLNKTETTVFWEVSRSCAWFVSNMRPTSASLETLRTNRLVLHPSPALSHCSLRTRHTFERSNQLSHFRFGCFSRVMWLTNVFWNCFLSVFSSFSHCSAHLDLLCRWNTYFVRFRSAFLCSINVRIDRREKCKKIWLPGIWQIDVLWTALWINEGFVFAF